MKSKILISIFTLLIIITTLIHTSFSENKLKIKSKVWKHRAGIPENTLLGFNKSYQEGFRGVEVDLQIIDQQLLIGHNADLATQNMFKLETLINQVILKDMNLWIDLKPTSPQVLLSQATKLKKYSLKSHKIFIETKSFLSAFILKLYEIPVILWYEPPQSIPNSLYNYIFKFFMSYFKIDHASFDYRNASIITHIGSKYKLMSFTISDKNELKKICVQKKNEVILTSLSFEDISSMCK